MKITNNLDGKAMYLQVRDVKYLREIFNFNFPNVKEIEKKKDTDFIFIDDETLTSRVKDHDEILEVSDFLKMNFSEFEQYLDDAEQIYAISKKMKAPYSKIQKNKYAYKSAMLSWVENSKNTLSFDLPMTINMLDEDLYYKSNGEYYVASTPLPDTYMMGRIDNEKLDNGDGEFSQFVNKELADILGYNYDDLGENVTIKKTKENGEKRLYYTIRKK